MTDVKRRYDGAGRQARAELVRQRLISTARAVLLQEGYAELTIPTLATACGVSAESVYKRFGGKPALVRAVVEDALRGLGPVAAETRSDGLDSTDLQTLVAGWGRLAAEVAPRVAPILLLVQAAATQAPELRELAQELDENRRARMRDNARRLQRAGHLPAGLSVRRATDILWTYSSPELYQLLVLRCGWSAQQYAAFVTTGITAGITAGVVGGVGT